MKLSEKGKENLAGFGFAYDCDGAMALLDDYDFEPDDFESPHPFLEKQGIESEKGKTSHHVVLTIDQAKELALKLKNNAEFFFLQTGEFDYDTDELWQCLTDKIEQAEATKICDDYNKALNKVVAEFQEQAEGKR